MYNISFILQLSTSDAKMAPKAKGLLKQLKSKSIICYAHFLHDVLTCLARLSLTLQQSDSSIYMCHEQLKVTKLTLNKLIDE